MAKKLLPSKPRGRPKKPPPSPSELLVVQQGKEAINRKRQEIVEGLPHLYGFKWYTWARAFFESKNKMNLLCAANQISKSSTQIRKCIEWATNPKLQAELWPNRKPRIFFYMYPSADVATIEFEKKWIPEFLPRNNYKVCPIRGWRAEYDKKMIKAVHFNTGVSVYFKTYEQKSINLQTATCDAVFTDEELPKEFYDELKARMFASDGYFHMVFTATLGQEIWARAMEGEGEKELFPDAFKQQVTMFDCMYYEDGSPGAYTKERINEILRACSTEAEKQKRVYGKFIADSGRKYPTFNAAEHYAKPFPLPTEWKLYGGVDVGSGGPGGKETHPGAICFVAVRPDFQLGVVYRAWRGDASATTAGDILNKFIELRGQDVLSLQTFDQNSRDFATISGRVGENFEKAEKSHEVGEQVINTLFKHNMIMLFDDDDEIAKLGGELQSLLKSTPKNKAKDDLADAFRYTVTKIPWDFSAIKLEVAERQEFVPLHERPFDTLSPKEAMELELMERRGLVPQKGANDSWQEAEEEYAYWNDAYGS